MSSEFKTIAARALLARPLRARRRQKGGPSGSQLSMFGVPEGDGEATAEAVGERRHLVAADVQYHVIETAEQRQALIDKLREQTIIAIDSSVNEALSFDSALTGLAFSYRENEAYFIP